MIAGHNRTKLIDGLDRQISAVSNALRTCGHEVPVHGALCFTKAGLPLFGALRMRNHILVHCKALAKRLNAKGALEPAAIDALAQDLARELPRA